MGIIAENSILSEIRLKNVSINLYQFVTQRNKITIFRVCRVSVPYSHEKKRQRAPEHVENGTA